MQELIRAFQHITFEDYSHRYVDTSTGEVLISTTTLLKRYFPPFRKDYWLAHGATKKAYPQAKIKSDFSPGVPHDFILVNGHEIHYSDLYTRLPEEVQALADQWDEAARFGREKGTACHNHLELLTLNKVTPISEYDLMIQPFIEVVDDYYAKHRPVPFATEVVLGSSQARIGGMADFIGYEDGLYVLRDYKTDKSLAKTKPAFEKCLPPIDTLDATAFNKHALQLTLYKWLIESYTSIKISRMEIVNFQPDGFTIFPVPPMKVALKAILLHYLEKEAA